MVSGTGLLKAVDLQSLLESPEWCTFWNGEDVAESKNFSCEVADRNRETR